MKLTLTITALFCLGITSTYGQSTIVLSASCEGSLCAQICSPLKNNPIEYPKCQSAYQFAEGVNQLVSQLTQTTAKRMRFNYYYHPANPPYTNQTPNRCCSAFAPSFAPYMEKFTLHHGGGKPLCQMLRFNESVSTVTKNPFHSGDSCELTSKQYKNPINYFKALLPQQRSFPQYRHNLLSKSSAWQHHINALGAGANTLLISQIPTGNKLVYYPQPPNYTTSTNNHRYIGISGGGGSGAGFEVFHNKQAIFSGGFGGGGGMTSPEGNTKLASGAGGGGGLQLSNGYGIGAGTSSNETEKPQFSFYTPKGPITSPKQITNVIKQFYQGTKRLNKGTVLVIKGGGGMGAGFELLKQTKTDGIQEYTPHAYSSGSGFQFNIVLAPTFNKTDATLFIPMADIVKNTLMTFYKNMGMYWQKASERRYLMDFKKQCKGGWGSCPVCMTKLQNYAIFCQAKTIPGFSFESLPGYMKFNIPNNDPKRCKKIPSSNKVSISEFNKICSSLPNVKAFYLD